MNGAQGVLGGPHHVITEIDKAQSKGKICQYSYFTDQYQVFVDNFEDSASSLPQNPMHNFLCSEDHIKSNNIEFFLT